MYRYPLLGMNNCKRTNTSFIFTKENSSSQKVLRSSWWLINAFMITQSFVTGIKRTSREKWYRNGGIYMSFSFQLRKSQKLFVDILSMISSSSCGLKNRLSRLRFTSTTILVIYLSSWKLDVIAENDIESDNIARSFPLKFFGDDHDWEIVKGSNRLFMCMGTYFRSCRHSWLYEASKNFSWSLFSWNT